jgi:hypothetical protein
LFPKKNQNKKQYANTAKSIENKPEVNQRMTKRTYVKEIHVEMERLNLALAAARNKDGVYLPTDQYAELNEKVRTSEAAQKEAEQALARRQLELQDAIERFNISEADLAAVRAELAGTQQTLVDTTAVLDVREEKLDGVGSKGAATRDEGVKASADVAALHLKVGRKASVVSRNAASAKNLAEKVEGDLCALSTAMRDALTKRKQQHSELCVSLQAHATVHAERSAAISHMIANAERLCAHAVAASVTNVDAFEAAASAASIDAHDALKQELDALKQAIATQADSTASAFAAQQQALAAHQEAFVSFVEKDVHAAVALLQDNIVGAVATAEASGLVEATVSATAKTDAHTKDMGELRKSTESALRQANEAYDQAHSDNVAAFGQDIERASSEVNRRTQTLEETLRAHAEASASGLTAMRAQMESMMQEFVAAQDTRLAEAVAQLSSGTEKTQSGLTAVMMAHAARADAERTQIADTIVAPMTSAAAALETRAAEGVSALCESFVATASAAAEKWSHTNMAVASWSEGVTTAAGEFIVMSAAAHEDSTAQVVAASTAAAMAKVQQSAAVDTIATAADASQKSAASALAAHSTAVKAQLDDEILKPIACELSEPGRTTMGVWDAAIAANAEEAVAAIEAAVCGAESDLSAHVAATERVSSTVNAFFGELAVDVSTGATPVKRVYDFPSPFGKMTPREKVLRRYRGEEEEEEEEKEAVVQVAPALTKSEMERQNAALEHEGEDEEDAKSPEKEGEGEEDSSSPSQYEQGNAEAPTSTISETAAPAAPQAAVAADAMPGLPPADEANEAEHGQGEENSKEIRKKTRVASTRRASKIPLPTKAKKKTRIVRKKPAAKSSLRRSTRGTPAKALRELN